MRCRSAAIPVGTIVHNVEMKIGKGGGDRPLGRDVTLRSSAAIRAMSSVRLSSGEQRLIHGNCFAHGRRGVEPRSYELVARQGGPRSRWLGRRPHNRGVTMNPVDHPHGGGEGRTSGGRHPVSPWGKPTKGKKTRSNKSDRQIHRRPRGTCAKRRAKADVALDLERARS